MSRRHLSFVVVAIASLALSACSAAPTSPLSPSVSSSHGVLPTAPIDTTARSGYSGSNT